MHCSSVKGLYFSRITNAEVSYVIFFYCVVTHNFSEVQVPSYLHYVHVPYGAIIVLEYSVETEAVIRSVTCVSVSRQ